MSNPSNNRRRKPGVPVILDTKGGKGVRPDEYAKKIKTKRG